MLIYLRLKPKWLQVLITKIVTTFYRRVFVAIRNFEEDTSDLNPALPIEISLLLEKDLPFYRKFRPSQNEQMIRDRMSKGDVCFAVWHDQRIVHAGWIATEGAYANYLKSYLVLPLRNCYLYDGYTLPEYRHHGLARLRHCHTFRYFREKGFTRAVMICALENELGRELLLSAGWKIIGLYTFVRLGPWQRISLTQWDKYPLPPLVKSLN